MRKSSKVLALVLSCILVVGLFAGCSDDLPDELKITSTPKTTFEVGEDLTNVVILGVQLVEKNNTYTLELKFADASYNKLTGSANGVNFEMGVTGFSLATAVEKATATVQYNKLAANFEYSVKEKEEPIDSKGFAGGQGTEADPYEIANAGQFMLLNNYANTSSVYFELTEDIDLSTQEYGAYAMKMNSNYDNIGYVSYFCGKLDGNDHKIYGAKASVFAALTNGAEVSDVEYVLSNCSAFAAEVYQTVVLNNIVISGSAVHNDNGSNIAFLVNYAYYGKLTMNNCEFKATVLGNAAYASAFVSVTGSGASYYITMNNCKFTGRLQAMSAAAFITNTYPGASTTSTVNLNNCAIEGTLESIVPLATRTNCVAVGSTNAKFVLNVENLDTSKATDIDYSASDMLTVTLDETNHFNITTENTEVAKVVVIGYTYAGLSDGGSYLVSAIETATKNEAGAFVTANMVKAQAKGYDELPEGVVNFGDLELCNIVVEDGVAYYALQNNSTRALTKTANMTFVAIAYDAEGNVIGGKAIK